MHYRDPELRSNHGAGGGGIHVSDHDDPVRSIHLADYFVSDHDPAGLMRMSSAANTHVEIRDWESKILENSVRHVVVVMLASVNQERHRPTRSLECVI
jgi:hypothetical protein